MTKKTIPVQKSSDGKKAHVRHIEIPDIETATPEQRKALKEQLQQVQHAIAVAENEGFVSQYAKAAWSTMLTNGHAIHLEEGESYRNAFSFYGGVKHSQESVEANMFFAVLLEADKIDWSTATDPFADSDFVTVEEFAGTFVDYTYKHQYMMGKVSSFDGREFTLCSEVDDEYGMGQILKDLIASNDTPFEQHKERYLEKYTNGYFDWV